MHEQQMEGTHHEAAASESTPPPMPAHHNRSHYVGSFDPLCLTCADKGRFMNGAESLVRTLVASGVEVCFANPGTSEMHFVAALDKVDGMRCALCLFEGVATGAADGYARMVDKPASTLLHLGPGLGNGLANLHNAKRARSPVVN